MYTYRNENTKSLLKVCFGKKTANVSDTTTMMMLRLKQWEKAHTFRMYLLWFSKDFFLLTSLLLVLLLLFYLFVN